MANERLYQFPSKSSPVPADIIYVGDSANSFNEVQSTIAQIIAAYPNLSGYAALTLGNNSYAYTNGSGTLTAGTITGAGVKILAVTSVNSAVLQTDDSGNVTFGTTLPTGVQTNITETGIVTVGTWSATVSGATIDNSVIGGTTPAAATFTSITLTAQANNLSMNSHKITSLADPSSAQDAMTLNYAGSTYLALAGGTMAGVINIGANKITNLATPTVSTDASTKAYADLMLPLAGGTMSGAINMGGFQVTNAADPTSAQNLATKNYVDTIATGGAALCVAATTANLTVTYSNGVAGVGATLTNAGAQVAFSIDGQSPTVGQRVLIKNQSTTFQNGVYTVTNVGSGSTNWVLTRATDYDTVTDINNTGLIPVQSGTANANTGWYNTTIMVTIGTTAITYIQFGVVIPSTSTANLALLSTGSGNGTAWSTKPPFTKINIQTFSGSGTYTPSSGLLYAVIEAWGGGAGGGTATAGGSSVSVSGGGGGAGGYSRITATAATIGASQTVTIGTGGGSATNGGDTSVGSICIAKGGTKGANSSSTVSGIGGLGGIAGTGDLAGLGMNGGSGLGTGVSSVNSLSGYGGSTLMGSGGQSIVGTANGNSATGYGGGGSGGANYNNAGGTQTGGSGTGGYVIVTEFIVV